jgi:hypothetical protein
MLLRVKSPVFIDRFSFEFDEPHQTKFKAVLKDDRGSICRALEPESNNGQQVFDWEGLSELPYGVYTLEILGASNEMKAKIVKRI